MTVKVWRGVRIYAARLREIVSAVTIPGVNGSGKNMFAEIQHSATHIDIFVRSAVLIFFVTFVCKSIAPIFFGDYTKLDC